MELGPVNCVQTFNAVSKINFVLTSNVHQMHGFEELNVNFT